MTTSATRTDLAALLERHIGRGRGITARQIAEQLGCADRVVRELVTELRLDGLAVCGRPETGYFIAATAEELQETCEFLRARAMHSLVLESRMRHVPLPDLVGQLRLKT